MKIRINEKCEIDDTYEYYKFKTKKTTVGGARTIYLYRPKLTKSKHLGACIIGEDVNRKGEALPPFSATHEHLIQNKSIAWCKPLEESPIYDELVSPEEAKKHWKKVKR